MLVCVFIIIIITAIRVEEERCAEAPTPAIETKTKPKRIENDVYSCSEIICGQGKTEKETKKSIDSPQFH